MPAFTPLRTYLFTAQGTCAMKLAGYICTVVLLLSVHGSAAQPTPKPREHLIDLTNAAAVPSGSVPAARQLSLQVPVAVSPHHPVASSIRVLPPQLDRAEYRLGDPFFFEVVIENVSSSPLEFPTLLDGSMIDRDMAGAAVASVVLTFDDKLLGRQTVSPQFLYGSRDVPGSLVAVEPHESLRIRVQGRWILSRATGTPKAEQWPRQLRVNAAIMVTGNGVVRVSGDSPAGSPVMLRISTVSGRVS